MKDSDIERLLDEARGNEPAPQPVQPATASPAPAAEGVAQANTEDWVDRLFQLRLASILTQRYVDLKLGDFWGTAILILQAPLIGYLVGLAFEGKAEGASLQFVLAMVAVWLGTFNSCREVVKERLIFLRERRTGVTVRAYLLSKLLVLTCFAALQCLLLVFMVSRTVRFDSSLPLVFLILLLTALSATCLGLLLSSAVKSQNALIALVPIVLIPQLIFSDVVLGNVSDIVERIELAMMADWCLDMLRELRKDDPSWWEMTKGAVVLVGMGLGLLGVAGVCLRAQEE